MYFEFLDLDKAFDQEPRNVAWGVLKKLRVEKWLVKILQFISTVGIQIELLTLKIIKSYDFYHSAGSIIYKLVYFDVLTFVKTNLSIWRENESLERSAESKKWLRVNVKKTKMMISGNNDAERAQKKASILLLFGKNM